MNGTWIMNEAWRNDPATEKQKAKLAFFGCTWDEGITKGKASDALTRCAELFPEKEQAWYDRPATQEQIQELEDYGEEIEAGMTYGAAKERLEECAEGESPYLDAISEDNAEFEANRHRRILEEFLNDGWWNIYYRPATLEEAKAAVDYLNQTKPGWKEADIVDAMQTLFSDYRFNEAMRGIKVRYCLPCRGRIDLTAEQLGQRISCPHCGRVDVFN